MTDNQIITTNLVRHKLMTRYGRTQAEIKKPVKIIVRLKS